MTNPTDDYLARLDHALRDVPHGVAADIRNGIAEELTGLGPDAVQQRITRLGDPDEIAREAMDATGRGAAAPAATSVAAAPAPKPSVTASRGFAIAAAIALGVGGFILPVVGWFVGVALVLMGAAWRAWEKAVALLLPLVVAVVLFAVSAMAAWWGGNSVDDGNPLVPMGGLATWHSALLLSLLLYPISGLWLLWRLRGRPTS